VFVGPLISRDGKIVGILYGDNLPENDPIPDTSCLEVFISQAGIALERALKEEGLEV
jgi:hypothetical protein